MSEKSKHQLRDDLVGIGIQALEHALRFLPEDNLIRKTIQEHLSALRGHDAEKITEFIRAIKPVEVYSPETCLVRASYALLKVSMSEKWLASSAVSANVFVPCWDAGSFIGLRLEEQYLEIEWQTKVLYPQIEQAFERARERDRERRRVQKAAANLNRAA